MSIWCRAQQVFIFSEASGIGSTKVIGIGLPITEDLGYLFMKRLFPGLSWLYPLIIF